MSDVSYFISLDEVIELHKMLIDEFEGSHGVRDLGLVESAVYRPQSGYYHSLSMQAAALLHSFALNRAFVDGNKRIAFAAAAVFLSVNGYRLELNADDGEKFIIKKIIQEKVELEVIAQWLEAKMRAKK